MGQQTAFSEAKKLLVFSKVLVHFNADSCDASPYGVGAVLSHKLNNGSEHPVAYASRLLTPAE